MCRCPNRARRSARHRTHQPDRLASRAPYWGSAIMSRPRTPLHDWRVAATGRAAHGWCRWRSVGPSRPYRLPTQASYRLLPRKGQARSCRVSRRRHRRLAGCQDPEFRPARAESLDDCPRPAPWVNATHEAIAAIFLHLGIHLQRPRPLF